MLSVEERDDATLLALARGGAEEGHAAFRALYDRHKDEVFTFLARFLRDDALAEDVLQEAFFRVYRTLDRCDPERPFRPWLHRIVRNAALDALRVRRKEARLVERAADRPDAAGGEVVPDVAWREEAERVREALEALPDEVRALLVQRHAFGMKLEELAESLSLNERTVRTRLGEAAKLLAEAFLASRAPKGDRS